VLMDDWAIFCGRVKAEDGVAHLRAVG